MNFQGLKHVETADFYLDVAIKRTKKKVEGMRDVGLRGTPLKRAQTIEIEKIITLESELRQPLYKILMSFPSLDNLPEFYRELLEITLDVGFIKKSLGAIKWCVEKNQLFLEKYKSAIKRSTEPARINVYRREFLGRISSTVKQIKKNLEYLEFARRTMVAYPNVKTGIPTIAIAGFPNIGKTTLLSKLTTSKPEIADYPFTTKGINIGYAVIKEVRVQFLDTPGTLNRFEQQNPIEKIATLALKYVTDAIVYVFDLTKPYSLDEQMKLYEQLKKSKKPVVVYLSKTDIIEKEKVDEFKKKFKSAITTIPELKEAIEKLNFEF